MHNKLSTSAVALSILILGGLLSRMMPAEDKTTVQPIPTETSNEKLRRSMAQKLPRMQKILEGLVRKDFEAIEDAASKLKEISLQAPKNLEGNDIDNQLYDHFKLEFLRLTTQLEAMAKAKNAEGGAFVYQNLTSNCMACHSYLANLD